MYDLLVSLGLSIEYEKELPAKDGNPKNFRLPDFTIHHLGRNWFWEHLGLLEESSYKADWELKKQWYKDSGYWERVITSEDHPGGLGGIVYADEIRKIAQKRIFGKS